MGAARLGMEVNRPHWGEVKSFGERCSFHCFTWLTVLALDPPDPSPEVYPETL